MLFTLSKQALGDQRPSNALTEMRSLCRLPPDTAGNSKKMDIFLALWLQRLPNPVRAAITNFSDFNDDDLAACADSLLNAHTATTCPLIHAATVPDPPDEVNLVSNPSENTSPLHLLHTNHHTPAGPPPSPRPKNLALDRRRTPSPPPPSGELTLLQNYITTTPMGTNLSGSLSEAAPSNVNSSLQTSPSLSSGQTS